MDECIKKYYYSTPLYLKKYFFFWNVKIVYINNRFTLN